MTTRPRDILKKPLPAGIVLGRLLDEYGLTASLSRHAIVNLWSRIVDKTVARHAKAERIMGTTLHVIVDSSVWMNELAAIKSALLEKINAHLKEEGALIDDIRFHQRSWAKKSPAASPDNPPPPPSAQDLPHASKILEPVKDVPLRDLLSQILENDRKLKWRRGTATGEHE